MIELEIKRRGKNVAWKIDIQQAYDIMEWEFLFRVLEKLSLYPKVIQWIWVLLASSRVAIIINGQPWEFFWISRGLKHGDPLSLSLFAIAEDVLSANLSWMVDKNIIKPMIRKGGYRSPIHLLFTDDIFVFTNGGMKGIRKIMELFDRYRRASGQVMNKAKTKIFLGKISLSRMVANIRETEFCLAELPEKYLGIRIIYGRVNKAAIANVVDDLSEKLSTYKGRMMSFTTRGELIKSVLEGSVVFSMAIYKWPDCYQRVQ